MKKFIITTSLIFAPMLASAAAGTPVLDLIDASEEIVQRLIILAVAIALLVFFWGIIKFVTAQGNEQSKVEAKKVMTWGIIALFVMVSIWGIVIFIQVSLLGGTSFSAPDTGGLLP